MFLFSLTSTVERWMEYHPNPSHNPYYSHCSSSQHCFPRCLSPCYPSTRIHTRCRSLNLHSHSHSPDHYPPTQLYLQNRRLRSSVTLNFPSAFPEFSKLWPELPPVPSFGQSQRRKCDEQTSQNRLIEELMWILYIDRKRPIEVLDLFLHFFYWRIPHREWSCGRFP